jgi:hypothetical protein
MDSTADFLWPRTGANIAFISPFILAAMFSIHTPWDVLMSG